MRDAYVGTNMKKRGGSREMRRLREISHFASCGVMGSRLSEMMDILRGQQCSLFVPNAGRLRLSKIDCNVDRRLEPGATWALFATRQLLPSKAAGKEKSIIFSQILDLRFVLRYIVYMNKTTVTCKMIETTFAATLAREGFKKLEVYMRGMRGDSTLWTICGPLDSVTQAAGWLVSKGLLALEEAPKYDAECDEAYAYMASI